eukprot:scaffold3296_cov405-Prasinococcus_capsulatus_cf.AAC.7
MSRLRESARAHPPPEPPAQRLARCASKWHAHVNDSIVPVTRGQWAARSPAPLTPTVGGRGSLVRVGWHLVQRATLRSAHGSACAPPAPSLRQCGTCPTTSLRCNATAGMSNRARVLSKQSWAGSVRSV